MIPTMAGILSSGTITPQTQTFTTSGSFTVPVHVPGSLTVELFGAGGGGANAGGAGTGGSATVYDQVGGLVGSGVGGAGADGTNGFSGNPGGVSTNPAYTTLAQTIGGGSTGGGGVYNGGNGGYLMVNVDSGGVHAGDLLTVDPGIGGFSDFQGGSAGNNGRVIFAWNVES